MILPIGSGPSTQSLENGPSAMLIAGTQYGWLKLGSSGAGTRVMRGSWDAALFPNVDDYNAQITRPPSHRYNCMAWAAGDDLAWWEPDPMGNYYWPDGVEWSDCTRSTLTFAP